MNVARATIEERRGPARHSQEDTPILDALTNFHAENTASFAIPAHKSGMGAPSYAKEVLGEQAFLADQTMLNGVDNRHESWGVQTAAQNLAAEALGADQCLFSTNGSTGSVPGIPSVLSGGSVAYGFPSLSTWRTAAPALAMPLAPGKVP